MTTKNLLLATIVLTLISTINIKTAFALPLWQYGIEDQSFSEFKTVNGGSFEPNSTISVGNVSNSNPVLLSGANSPGYLYTHNPNPEFSHVTTAAIEALTFEFVLEIDYRQLDLNYGRFGSEMDRIFFDGIEHFQADGTAENQWDLFEFALKGNILAGSHTLTLAYGGGGADNGHYMDFLRLENGIPADNGGPAPVPEPGTLILVGTGIVGLLGFRKKNRRS